MSKIFYDENRNYKFNFNDTLEVFEPHSLSQKTTMLADADFVRYEIDLNPLDNRGFG